MNNFLAFWHSFGPHGGEQPEAIIVDKQGQISNNEWTLWSFDHKRPETIETWISEIGKVSPERVLVLCSAWKGRDPCDYPENIGYKGTKISAREYMEYRESRWQDWQAIPKEIRVTHPKRLASAFKVSKIILPGENNEIDNLLNLLSTNPMTWHPTFEVEWFKITRNCWLTHRPDSRYREFLIRAGNGFQLRPIRAVLVLTEPYVVKIRNPEHP